MSRENGGSSPEDLTTPEEGLAGAYAEKPLRDARKSGVVMSPEEIAALKSVAEKLGDKAVADFRAEKELREKAPHKLLQNQIRELEKKWKEEHREQDLEIITELQKRLNVYIELLKDKGREQEPAELAHMYGRLPVTYKVGEKGGAIFRGDGLGENFFSKKDINDREMESKSAKQRVEILQQVDKEFINYSFTPEGESEFYRALGVLQENQTIGDLPQMRERRPDQKFEALVKTNIEGVKLFIRKDPQRDRDKQKEKGIFLMFNPEFIEKVISEK